MMEESEVSDTKKIDICSFQFQDEFWHGKKKKSLHASEMVQDEQTARLL